MKLEDTKVYLHLNTNIHYTYRSFLSSHTILVFNNSLEISGVYAYQAIVLFHFNRNTFFLIHATPSNKQKIVNVPK